MEELYLEHVEGLENGIEFLSISPFILVNIKHVEYVMLSLFREQVPVTEVPTDTSA